MKTRSVAAVGLGVALFASPSLAAKKHFKANIEGGAVGSPGVGLGNFTFDDGTKKLCGKATYAGLTGGAVNAVALKNANDLSLVKPLTSSASPILVETTLTDAEIALLNAVPGDLYIAIGNATYPVSNSAAENGEVNGELLVDPAGVEQPCPSEVGDAGVDSGSDAGADSRSDAGADSGSDAAAPSSPSSSSSGGDTSPPLAEGGGEDASPVAKKDDGGCSTSGASTGSLALASLVVLLVAGRGRSRRR